MALSTAGGLRCPANSWIARAAFRPAFRTAIERLVVLNDFLEEASIELRLEAGTPVAGLVIRARKLDGLSW